MTAFCFGFPSCLRALGRLRRGRLSALGQAVAAVGHCSFVCRVVDDGGGRDEVLLEAAVLDNHEIQIMVRSVLDFHVAILSAWQLADTRYAM